MAIADAVNRSGRGTLWVVAPTAAQSPALTRQELAQAETTLIALVGRQQLLVSAQALGGVLSSLVTSAGLKDTGPAPIRLVTAGIESHPYELHVLDHEVDEIVDIASGQVWSRQKAWRAFGEPEILPLAFASTGQEPDEKSVVTYAKEPRYRDAIVTALEDSSSFNGTVPPPVADELIQKAAAIQAQAAVLRGDRVVDLKAQAALRLWLHANVHATQTATVYIVAAVVEERGEPIFERMEMLSAEGRQLVHGHDECVKALKAATLQRWFAPRALDLLAAAAAAGLCLPEQVADPAIGAFLLDPDHPATSEEICDLMQLCPREYLAWIADLKRRIPPPRRHASVAELLPTLDEALKLRLRAEGLQQLFDEDFCKTLPVLARIERQGARVGVPQGFGSWRNLREAVGEQAARCARAVATVSSLDLSRAGWDDVSRAFRRQAQLVDDQFGPRLSGEQYVSRLAYIGLESAAAVIELRSLTSVSGLPYWLSAMSGEVPPKFLRGKHVPERTGRWGMSRHPLQNIPKLGHGSAFRSGLQARGGKELLRADWNAFEGRLLAELSRDPVLLTAAQAQDFHDSLANQLGLPSREHAKAVFYAVLYGQSEEGFFGENVWLSRSQAQQTYKATREMLRVALKRLDQEEQKLRAGQWLHTPGGFRRLPERGAQARNFVVQGFGADCMRWVLRRLEVKLRPLRADVVNQSHDEVMVAAGPSSVALVEGVVRQTMEGDLVASSGLFKNGAKLRVNLEWRTTW